ncbi:MAG: hypothetical protein WCZ65_06045 [Lysobacteraceae bacterium]
MTSTGRDHLEMAFKSILCFANDGKLLPAELREIVDIALRDGVVDADEKRVLRNIIGRLDATELTADMLAKIKKLRSEHDF